MRVNALSVVALVPTELPDAQEPFRTQIRACFVAIKSRDAGFGLVPGDDRTHKPMAFVLLRGFGGGSMALKRDRMSMEPIVEEITQKSVRRRRFSVGLGRKLAQNCRFDWFIKTKPQEKHLFPADSGGLVPPPGVSAGLITLPLRINPCSAVLSRILIQIGSCAF